MLQQVVQRSVVPAEPDAVWERVASFEGVNHELMPIMRMTAPRHLRSLDPAQIRLGERICRSWCLLGGVIPFDYDDLTLVALEPGHGFHERSRMLSQRLWEHRRSLEPAEGGCLVTDRLSFEPRVPGTGRISRAVVGAIFRHRHKRLRAWFEA